jgi:hypothetical protein
MHRVHNLTFTVAAAALTLSASLAHGQAEAAHAVVNGGITVPGWTGKVDPNEARRGGSISGDKLAKEGTGMRVTTGPAAAFWNPANTATGDYTVHAKIEEPKYMNLNAHPHPYGVFIAGNDMGTDNQSYLYCTAYGDGSFIVRGFGPAPFQMGGKNPTPNAAVHKAGGKDQPVTQDISLSVKGDKVTCNINGTDVATYSKAELIGAGKLKSTDGVYGIRFAHNTDAIVTGFGKK